MMMFSAPQPWSFASFSRSSEAVGFGYNRRRPSTAAFTAPGSYPVRVVVTDPQGASATALAGQGLMGVARDNYPQGGQPFSFVAGFADVEVDVETGKFTLLDYLAVADVGTVLHPRSLGGQILGRSTLGIAHAIGQKWVYDKHYGVPLATRFYQNRPPTILDVPQKMAWHAMDIPDPFTPVGSRGIGEPPVGAGASAVLNALRDAVGDKALLRAPVGLDVILTSLDEHYTLEWAFPEEHRLRANI